MPAGCPSLFPVPFHPQVAETLPAEVLAKMHAPPKAADVPIIDPHIIDQVSLKQASQRWLAKSTGHGTINVYLAAKSDVVHCALECALCNADKGSQGLRSQLPVVEGLVALAHFLASFMTLLLLLLLPHFKLAG